MTQEELKNRCKAIFDELARLRAEYEEKAKPLQAELNHLQHSCKNKAHYFYTPIEGCLDCYNAFNKD